MTPLCQPRTLILLLMIFALGTSLMADEAALGDDFCVENQVFFGSSSKPDNSSTTIFHEGLVYDYMKHPAEVIVLDTQAERFVLLDLERRIRAELATADVAAFNERLARQASRKADPYLQFRAAPKFEEQYDSASGELKLSSPLMTYRLWLIAAGSAEIASQYRQFCDWYARLNAMLRPGSMPPTARLKVNEAMGRREAIPREVELTVEPKKTFPPRRTTVRSQHRLIREIGESDLDRVAQTQQFMAIFKPVGFDQYARAGRR